MPSITVTTTAQLVPSGGGRDVRSLPANTATIYLGGDATVTAANGYPLLPGEAYSTAVNDAYPDLYAIVASGTADLRYIL